MRRITHEIKLGRIPGIRAAEADLGVPPADVESFLPLHEELLSADPDPAGAADIDHPQLPPLRKVLRGQFPAGLQHEGFVPGDRTTDHSPVNVGIIEFHPAGFKQIFQQEGLPHFRGCHAREGRRVGRMTHCLGRSSHGILQ